jgi:type I restriction enzyme S subunit
MGDIRFISPEFHQKLRKSALAPGDVVIVRTGKPGTAAVIPDNLQVANCSDLVIVRCGPLLRPRFLSYWINAVSDEHIAAHVVGAVQQHFNVGSAKQIPILLPTTDEQDRILSLLGALDDKIELNRKMAETLEAMARAIYRSWFIDFDPVHANADGRAPAHMDPATAALFPDRFGEEGLPEGWEVRPLDQIAEFLNGLALQKYPAKQDEDSLPVIKIAELRNGVTAKSNRASRDVPDKYVIKSGDYIFSWSGSLMAKYWTGGEGALNQHLFKVTSKTHPMWLVSAWVEHHLAEFQSIAAAKAVTMGHIKRSHLSEAMCVLPSPECIVAMGEVIQPLVNLMIQKNLESQALAALRDTLLPRLMSGELRVGAAKEQIEAVA